MRRQVTERLGTRSESGERRQSCDAAGVEEVARQKRAHALVQAREILIHTASAAQSRQRLDLVPDGCLSAEASADFPSIAAAPQLSSPSEISRNPRGSASVDAETYRRGADAYPSSSTMSLM